MSRYNMNEYKVARVDETGGTYYYYLYAKPKSHANSDTTGWYIMRTNVAGTIMQYVFGTGNPLTAWTNKATYTYKEIYEW